MTWGDRVTFEVSSANPDDTPVWVDLTAYVLHESGIDLSIGRQDNLDQTQPASLGLTLRNNDDRFTYGNTSSPYAAWWGPGRKCRLRETYGSTVVDLFTGYLQVPQESQSDAKAAYQTVSVSAVDRLARLAAAPTFASTLGAQIVGSVRNNTLVGYWPLDDPALPFAPAAGTIAGTKLVSLSTTRSIEQSAALDFNGAPAIPGDDVTGLRFIPGLANGTPSLERVMAQFDFPTASRPIAAGQVLTLVTWINQDVDFSADGPFISATILTDSTSAILTLTKNTGNWRLVYFDGTTFGVTGSPYAATSRWYFIALRWGFTSNVLELWIDDQVYTGTFATVVTSAYLSSLSVGLYGSAAHAQIYVGAAADFTNADFLAQREVGLRGMDRQTTGDRIRTIAAYAGIPLAEYNDTIDKGTAIMQAASLADKTPLEAMREAERTEQGLLYVDGSGRLVFKDRRSLYNV